MLGSLFTGVANVASGLIANSANKRIARETNEANIRMNAENNALQRELFEKKYDKDLEQWNRQNEYNSPVAQVERLKEAGLNPALSGIQTGLATSSPEMGVPATTSGHSEIGTPVQALDFSPFGTMELNASQVRNIKADTDSKTIDNVTRNLRNIEELNKLKAETNSTRLRNAYQGMQNSIFDNVHSMDMRLKESELELRKSQMHYTITQNAFKAKELSAFDGKQKAEIANLIADTAGKYASARLSKQQMLHLIQSDKHLSEVIKGSKLDNKQKSEIMQYVIKEAEYNAEIARYKSIPSSEDHWNEIFDYELKSGEWYEKYPAKFMDLVRGVNYLFNPLNGLFKGKK
uniref:DNA pilot protein n=1 Tax=Dulem virus 221 TaxID=3145698 RepID=A0AAU8B136_9VIRU